MSVTAADYYTLLNIKRDASPDDIKKSFRTLAHRFHPDKNPGDIEAEERFKEISQAYEVLSDPEKRVLYDRTGRSMFESMYGSGNMQGGMGCAGKRGCGCGRGRGGRAAWSHLMQNMAIHEISVTREEAVHGAEISIKPANASDEAAFQVRLPGNLQHGTVLRCMNSGTGDDFFIRIVIADE